VRRAGARALGAIGRGAADAVPALIHLANDPERRAVRDAIAALGAIARDEAEAVRARPVPPIAAKAAVGRGLAWLAAQQDESGAWDCEEQGGSASYDTGVTGLALLCFLNTENPALHADTLRRGLRRLVAMQDAEGCIGARTSRAFLYLHATATLALCDAARVLRDPAYRAAAQRAVDFILAARHPEGAWRYELRAAEADTSVTGWMVACLRAGEAAGLRVDRAAYGGALAYVESVTDPGTGRTGYSAKVRHAARPKGLMEAFPANHTRSMTAAGLVVRLAAGQERDTPVLSRGVEECLALLPQWNVEDGYLDMYYWFQGTRAIQQVQGMAWRRWSKTLREVVVPRQRGDDAGALEGSWDPLGPWGPDGGRVYATAAMVLCLETTCGWVRPFELSLPAGGKTRAAVATLRAALVNPEPAIREAAANALAGLRH